MDAQPARRARADAPLGLSAESLLDASPNLIIAVDSRGRIVYASPKVPEAFGYYPGELRGEPIERLVPSRLGERHAAHRAEYARYPSARPMGGELELAARRQDGTEFPVEISLAAVPSTR